MPSCYSCIHCRRTDHGWFACRLGRMRADAANVLGPGGIMSRGKTRWYRPDAAQPEPVQCSAWQTWEHYQVKEYTTGPVQHSTPDRTTPEAWLGQWDGTVHYCQMCGNPGRCACRTAAGRSKVSDRTKAAIVAAYVPGIVGRIRLGKAFGLPPQTVRAIVAAHDRAKLGGRRG